MKKIMEKGGGGGGRGEAQNPSSQKYERKNAHARYG